MNLWHEVRVSRTGRQAVLQIDDRPSSQATAPGAFTQLSLPQNLYIGGVPNFEMVSPKVRVRTSFVGCIQKVLINGKSLEMLSSALGGINIVNCNHPCASRPCGSGARCVPILDSYQCECLGDEPGVPAPEEGCPDGENDEDFDVDVEASILADNNEAILDVSEDVAEGLLQDIPVPRFNGESFLHYTDAETIRRILSFQLNINIRFRTTSPDGLLLWSGRQKDEETENEEKGRSKKDEQHPTVNLNGNNRGDFLALGLSDGYLHFRFNLGGGELFLRYNSTRVDDGLWHRVQAFRNEQQGSLVVDNGVKLSRRAPGTLKQLNTNTGLYIGGMENLENGSNGKYHSGLIGCISDLILDTDYHLKLVQMASAGRNVQHCD